mmetsp:Transcript_41470/g.102305  ORF Transcript_41470/g.102305 Transcript_41470/m.102305 type:complete len:326 (-) Transcript_41470:852-1829(-)
MYGLSSTPIGICGARASECSRKQLSGARSVGSACCSISENASDLKISGAAGCSLATKLSRSSKSATCAASCTGPDGSRQARRSSDSVSDAPSFIMSCCPPSSCPPGLPPGFLLRSAAAAASSTDAASAPRGVGTSMSTTNAAPPSPPPPPSTYVPLAPPLECSEGAAGRRTAGSSRGKLSHSLPSSSAAATRSAAGAIVACSFVREKTSRRRSMPETARAGVTPVPSSSTLPSAPTEGFAASRGVERASSSSQQKAAYSRGEGSSRANGPETSSAKCPPAKSAARGMRPPAACTSGWRRNAATSAPQPAGVAPLTSPAHHRHMAA